MGYFDNFVMCDLDRNEIIYCGIGCESGNYYYLGLNKNFEIITKNVMLLMKDFTSSKSNYIGSRKQPLKKFCNSNDKIYISNLINLIDNKIRNIEFFKNKY